VISKILNRGYRRRRYRNDRFLCIHVLITLMLGFALLHSFASLKNMNTETPFYEEAAEEGLPVAKTENGGGIEDKGATLEKGSYFRDLSFLKSALAENIPVMETGSFRLFPGLSGPGIINGVINVLLGLDFSRPQTLLVAELSGMELFPLPAVYYPSVVIEGGEWRDKSEQQRGKNNLPKGEGKGTGTSSSMDTVNRDEPVIIIYHTHTTETFVPTVGKAFTEELEKSVAFLGEKLKQQLEEEYGLAVLHNKKIHDVPRTLAYSKARPTLEKLLQENQNVKMVIDLHRDGVSRSLTTAIVDGKEIGNILIVLGSNHEGWQDNLKLALSLQQHLERESADLSRGIRQKKFNYNQDLHPGALIIEIGGHENSLEEALLTIPYLARAIAETYHANFKD
jgi:stage II sporulation protein P